MKRKIAIIISIISAMIILVVLCVNIIFSIMFFRETQIYENVIDSKNENTIGILLNPDISLHQSLLKNKNETEIFSNYFQNQESGRQDGHLPIHIYKNHYETDEFNVVSALVADSMQKGKFTILWEVIPKKKTVFLNQYDFELTSSNSFHWDLEANNNNMLIRYSNSDNTIWAQTPMSAAAGLWSNNFPSCYWSKFYPIINMRPDLVQIWSNGFYSFEGDDSKLIQITLTLSKKGLKQSTFDCSMEWWSGMLPINNVYA